MKNYGIDKFSLWAQRFSKSIRKTKTIPRATASPSSLRLCDLYACEFWEIFSFPELLDSRNNISFEGIFEYFYLLFCIYFSRSFFLHFPLIFFYPTPFFFYKTLYHIHTHFHWSSCNKYSFFGNLKRETSTLRSDESIVEDQIQLILSSSTCCTTWTLLVWRIEVGRRFSELTHTLWAKSWYFLCNWRHFCWFWSFFFIFFEKLFFLGCHICMG